MEFLPFFKLCPEIASDEMLVVAIKDHDVIPDDAYAFIELYCTDPACDCRRAQIHVITRTPSEGMAAVISYGWEPREFYDTWVGNADEDMSGAQLDPLNEQSSYAEALLTVFQEMLAEDAEYAAIFPRHYAAFKAALPTNVTTP